MSELAVPRKLASIVAVDVAGYSRRTESDETASVRAVTALRARVAKSAAAHGGRVFNTAGDGFMLEFPTASGALAAAEEIAAAGDPPVRVGVHLGEVSVTESGDLLGHGVNVAARIQQMASPGAVLASGDVKRAIRGPLGDRLRPQGAVRLDKMSETLPVFALAPDGGGRAKGMRRKRVSLVVVALAGSLVALAGLGWWISLSVVAGLGPAPSRIAILPFATLTPGQSAQAFAQGLADKLQGVLIANNMQTVSSEDVVALRGPDRDRRMAQLGVKLLFDGDVKEEHGTLQVGIRLDDARQHVTLWTSDLSGPADQPDALQAQAGGRIVSVLTCARQALKPKGGLADATALSLYLKACDLYVAAPGGSADIRDDYRLIESLREVVAKAPDFAPARAAFAKYLAWYAPRMPAERMAVFRTQAEQEARRVLAVDTKQPDAYLALERLQPGRNFAASEHLLDQALAADPDSSNANSFMAQFLAETGRIRASLAYTDHASVFDPFCLCSSNYQELAWIGQTAAANAQLARFVRLYPHLRGLWFSAGDTYSAEGDWKDYDAWLKDRASWPAGFVDKYAASLRLIEEAEKGRKPATLAAARRAILAAEALPLQIKISDLARLGFVDDAFRLGEAYARDSITVYNAPTFLFTPDTASLRRDRRFMGLAAELGLVSYWRSTGKWPDFCAEPGLPYDCKAEAAKYARGRRG